MLEVLTILSIIPVTLLLAVWASRAFFRYMDSLRDQDNA